MTKFHSTQTHENHLIFTQMDGYTHYRFCVLHSYLNMLFDFMRYERCFFYRRPVVDQIIDSIKRGASGYDDLFEVSLVQYAWSKKKPDYTYGRLSSTQRLVETDIIELGFGGRIEREKPAKKLKFASDIVVTGDVEHILNVMWNNNAMPSTEADAHTIERWRHCIESEPTKTVTLRTYVEKEQEWKL